MTPFECGQPKGLYTNGSPIQKPLFETKSEWELPKDLPNLKNAKLIGLDTETKDPKLKTKGPGVRRDGYIVGISVAVPSGEKWYFPFNHAEGKQFEKEKIINWARDNLCQEGQAKVGANILYDLDYLYHNKVPITGPFYDIQIAEPLLDENKFTYSLDSLAQQYLGEHKNEKILKEACSNFGLKGDPQSHIWRLDPKYTGEYAEDDAWQSLQVFLKQKPLLEQQNLLPIFDIETRLIPMMLHMRQLGVPIDLTELTRLHDLKTQELKVEIEKLNSIAGTRIDYWAAESIAKIFDKMGEWYPLTPKTKKPSFVKGWLEGHHSEIAKAIVRCRTLDKLIGTFLEGSLLEMLVNGNRIHCEFHQAKGDENGTVTGRLSSSHPNLQFIPIRTDEGKAIRRCFIPDKDHDWCKCDYSQIEIRILAHYAMGRGADDVRKAFHLNPKIDYHQWCADNANKTRRQAKCINFGLIYGMGDDKLAGELGISREEASDFKKEYFAYLPFLKKTIDTATETAASRGYVHTLLGRRRRFNLWEPNDYDLARIIKPNVDKEVVEQRINEYCQKHPGLYKMGVKRAGCYRAFNAADQGTAADIMKKSMVDVWESGVCDTIKPYITVHDELDFGFPKTKIGEEARDEVQQLMQNTMELLVPVIVDKEIGPNWGDVK